MPRFFVSNNGEKSQRLIWFPYMKRDFWNSIISSSTKVGTVKQRGCLQHLKQLSLFWVFNCQGCA